MVIVDAMHKSQIGFSCADNIYVSHVPGTSVQVVASAVIVVSVAVVARNVTPL